jgi:hypothetical protein
MLDGLLRRERWARVRKIDYLALQERGTSKSTSMVSRRRSESLHEAIAVGAACQL